MRTQFAYVKDTMGKRVRVLLTRWFDARRTQPTKPGPYRVKYLYTGPGKLNGRRFEGYSYWDRVRWYRPWSNVERCVQFYREGTRPHHPIECWRGLLSLTENVFEPFAEEGRMMG